MLDQRATNTCEVETTRVSKEGSTKFLDALATEEPLEIRVLKFDNSRKDWIRYSVAVTMRTPGNDFELATGFLFSEGVVKGKRDIAKISYCTDPKEKQLYNIVNVYLSDDVIFDPNSLSRQTYTSSSCGICGKRSIELVRSSCSSNPTGTFRIPFNELVSLQGRLSASQKIFSKTGGLHASAMFDREGRLIASREDIGRHNALDKLVGWLLMMEKIPARDTILIVSGRASFELVQKAALAGIPFIASVGAPSSLAVSLAQEYGMTLVGFLRAQHFNVYSGAERLE